MSDILFTRGHNLHFLKPSKAQYCHRNLSGYVSSHWRDVLSSDRTAILRKIILKYLHYEIMSTTQGHLNPSTWNPCALNPF